MLGWPIKHKDLDGKPVNRTYWFNLSKAEVAKFGLTQGNSLEKRLEDAVKNQDAATILELFEFIVGASYGVRKKDENNEEYFDKSEELTRRFLLSDAYSELFVDLLGNEQTALKFLHGVLPPELVAKMQQAGKTLAASESVELPQPDPTGDDIVSNTPAPEYPDDAPAWFKEDRNPTPAEFAASSDAYKQVAFAKRLGN